MQDVLSLLAKPQTHEIQDARSACSGPNRAAATLVKDFLDSLSDKLKPIGLHVQSATIGVNPKANLTDARRELEWLGFLNESNPNNSHSPENLPIVEE